MPFYNHPIPSAFGQNVREYDGAKLVFYEPGTNVPKPTYTSQSETVQHPDPVVADGNGLFPAIFITGAYDVILTDKNDVMQWEAENVQELTSVITWTGGFDSSTNAGDYPVSGNQGDYYKVTASFTLNAASGSHDVYTGDFIVCNKNGATGIDADWDIIKGNLTILDEDDMISDSPSQAPSQQSVVAYVASLDPVTIKGSTDCSTNPNYPAADAGDRYYVSVAGKIGGASGVVVQVMDSFTCTVDGSAAGTQAAVGANWVVGQGNVVQATETQVGYTRYSTQVETDAVTNDATAITPLKLHENKLITFLGDQAVAQSMAVGWSIIQFASVYDSNSGYNAGTYEYTIPYTGIYDIRIQANLVAIADTKRLAMGVYVDTVFTKSSPYNIQSGTGTMGAGFSALMQLTAGEKVDLRLFNGDTVARLLEASIAVNYASITYMGK